LAPQKKKRNTLKESQPRFNRLHPIRRRQSTRLRLSWTWLVLVEQGRRQLHHHHPIGNCRQLAVVEVQEEGLL